MEALRRILPAPWDPGDPMGVLLFGSRAREDDGAVTPGDWDIGLIVSDSAGPAPPADHWPGDWDVFVWSEAHWRRGFALQLELARTARVLHDPSGLIGERFAFLREEVLPRWGRYLRR